MASTDQLPHEVLEFLLESVKQTDDVDVLRETAQWLIQQLIEADVSQQIGAKPYERTEERKTHRNGSRPRTLETRLGELEIKIPKLREGTYYPDWLLQRKRPAERALLGVVMEAYVNGVSTRKMQRIVQELGLEKMDKSKVSRINKELDERVRKFLGRPLQGPYPYVWLDATDTKVREDGRVQSTALVTAMGVNEDGRREILGISIGSSETESAWKQFLRQLVDRGLSGVQLVISDAHKGLKKAMRQVLTGTTWQRCKVHFQRNIADHVPNSAEDRVNDMVRSVFEQPTPKHCRVQMDWVIDDLREEFTKAANILEEAAEDLLAFTNFPKEHWKRIWSNNPLERQIREIKRRFDVVGIFPNRKAVTRLGGAMLMERNDEWMTGRRYFSQKSIAQVLAPQSRSAEPDDKAAN